MKDDPIASTEYIAVRDALLQFRYCDGRPVDPHERNLCANLLQLGETYSANGHWIAAELDRLASQVARMPRTAPEYPNWFIATIEARLIRRTRATGVNLTATVATESRRILGSLMEHTTLPKPGESFPAEIRARQFERLAGGDRFQAVQDCLGGFLGSTDSLEGQLRLEALWYMLDEGWGRISPLRKAPVVEFGQQERKKQA